VTIRQKLFFYGINSFGWKSKRRIVVFESDDWGSTRMPSKKVYERLLRSPIKVDSCPYSKFDSLESPEDFECLYDVLLRFRDFNGFHPKFTTNFLVTNPNYEKIRESDYTQYYFEGIEDTYLRYGYATKRLIDLGIKENLIYPQLHGREHLNTPMWLDLLEQNMDVRLAADTGLYLLSFANISSIKLPYLASFMPYKSDYLKNHLSILQDSYKLFVSFFHNQPKSFVAPVYVWHNEMAKELNGLGIRSIQGLFRKVNFGENAKRINTTNRTFNKVDSFGNVNLVRNCFFEPSLDQHKDWISEVLHQIEIAFMFNRPAVICSHRLNYIGSINSPNRKSNLKSLNDLLTRILAKWPNVEFLSSDQLCEHLSSD